MRYVVLLLTFTAPRTHSFEFVALSIVLVTHFVSENQCHQGYEISQQTMGKLRSYTIDTR